MKPKPPFPNVFFAACCTFFAFSMLATSCKEKPPVDLREKRLDQATVQAMAAEIEALVNPEIEEGLTLKLWAVDSLINDPISINVDENGVLYYSRTNRQKNSEFDIRGHQSWEIRSISLQTVEEKRAFLREELSPERSSENQWLGDVNGDGSHDWRDMLIEKEQIYRVMDTDGDGLADYSQIMVEDFHDEVTDVAGAVMKRGDDLFVGVGPDMWRLKDNNGDGIMDEKTSISHGYGVHVGFGGHGMSGLEEGPDGRIYWGIGDIGFNGKGPDGTEWKYPNRGVIARANPDGSDFEIFAMGVRNTHEFVFDEFNNLISVDNDGDHRGESERLVYLVNGSDTGWRINWQFGKYRDPDNNTYKVWMDEGLNLPRHEKQPAYITPAIVNYVNGPTGMVYNPGTALSPKWKNTFFVVEFVGNPARSGIHAFKLKPKGASFELAETKKILGGVLPTGLDFGPDGSLYLSDWINGWDTKNYGRVWKLDDAEGANSAERQETQKLIVLDYKKLKEADLEKYLQHADMRIRRKAQFELATRGDKGAKVFESVIASKDNQVARINAIVGMSQLSRMKDMKYAKALVPLLKDSDPEIRAQAAKWIGDIRFKDAGNDLLPLLKDENSRASFFAAEALGRIAFEPAINPLIAYLEKNNDEDAFIRHAASLALARINKPEAIAKLSSHPSDAVRMGAVLALRRMEDKGIANFLSDKNEWIVTEAARAINDDFSIEPALPALADLLLSTPFSNEALIRRAISANLRVGTERSMQNLIAYMAMEKAPVAMRKEAIEALSTWTKPSVLDRVDGRNRGTITREPSIVRKASSMPLLELFQSKETDIRLSAVMATGKLRITEASEPLLGALKRDRDPEVRMTAIRALTAMEAPNTAEAIKIALEDSEKSVRVVGLDLLGNLNLSDDLKVNLLNDVIQKRTVEEKQAALTALGALPVSATKETFGKLLADMEKGKLKTEVLLEFSEAIVNTGDADLKSKYTEAETKLWKGDALASYQSSLEGGDVIKGRRIFFQSQVGQCMRCHSYDDFGGIAGPRLNGVAARLDRQDLLESLIDPSKKLSPGFGVVMLELNNGKALNGVLEKETNSTFLVKMGNRPDTLIQKAHVVSRKNAASSMPDMKDMLSRREIRDLVSFLATLKEED
ncbi:HEAT repeat domain-containing protein [Rhodonellum sp.]|uniref:HEAT repeat domain-containing protein n=1 Tax=Rhodonellum sp. TaxID=2231180 RepID=UPI0027195AF1|nr:HEAT repeat domain-containing protein [Rhodonellum sp.]MDO9554725.1 HEAT repeat domain-containing protein [Rhodonellum sp.]